MAVWIILGVIVLIVFYIGVTYNALTKARNRVKTNWAQIDVVLKRRAAVSYTHLTLPTILRV